MKCITCGKDIAEDWRKDPRIRKTKPLLYCSRSCANSRKRSDASKDKTRQTMLAKERKENTLYRVCIVCGGEFERPRDENRRLSGRRTCSDRCHHYSLSTTAQRRIASSGSWSTKRRSFSYKGVTLDCDSRLEEAAIIYLLDVEKVATVERYHNILNYWKGGYHRTFNPDFWAIKDNHPIIVEVKMRWNSNVQHTYNASIPYKKQALQSYAEKRGYSFIWLDFDYDKEFENIYRRHLSGEDY
jgi:hypothetical protein